MYHRNKIAVIYRTAMGRARAWLRMALMQKKLADYLKVLIDHKDDILSEYFEPDALMMSEEAIVVMGLLVGLNVIDCNFCVKVSVGLIRHRREAVLALEPSSIAAIDDRSCCDRRKISIVSRA